VNTRAIDLDYLARNVVADGVVAINQVQAIQSVRKGPVESFDFPPV